MLQKRKKLFLIINRLSHAGVSMDALSMAYYLADNYEVTIVYGEKEKDEKDALLTLLHPHIGFIKIESLHRSVLPFKDIVSFRKLLHLIKKSKPDIVHTHGFKTGLLGRIAAKIAAVPVIVHTFHGHVFHSYYSKPVSSFICFIERRLALISDRIIAISPQQAYELNTVYKIVPKEKTSLIFIGVDENNYTSTEDKNFSLRSDYRLPGHVVTIAIISRLVAIKNHSFLIRVIEKIWQQEKEICFFIIGEGYNKTAIQKELTGRKIEWKEGVPVYEPAPVYFTSWITDIASALQDIDIVVLTSLNEGTPVSLIEAQLFGKPVVATNVGGVRDTMIDGKTGFLIDNFDVDDFANKLLRLIRDKHLRSTMGNNGKIFVTERFSKQKEVAAIDALYKDCLQQKNTGIK